MTEKLISVMLLALDGIEERLKKEELTNQVQAELSILNQIATNVVMCENILLKDQVRSLSDRSSTNYPGYPSQSKQN